MLIVEVHATVPEGAIAAISAMGQKRRFTVHWQVRLRV